MKTDDRRDPTTRPDRFICSPSTPWRRGLPTPVVHPATTEIGDQEDGWPGGDTVRMRCAVCGHEWTAELPQ